MSAENAVVTQSNEGTTKSPRRQSRSLLPWLLFFLSCLLNVYLYEQGIVRPEPVLVVDPWRTQIIDSSKFSGTALHVSTGDGRRIESDLTSAVVYFFNYGRKPILESDVVKEICIVVGDPATEIVSYNIVQQSREETGFVVTKDSSNPRLLKVHFHVLDNQDGAAIQIIYAGPIKAPITVVGSIVGAKTIGSEISGDEVRLFFFIAGNGVKFLLIGIVLLLGLGMFGAGTEQFGRRLLKLLRHSWGEERTERAISRVKERASDLSRYALIFMLILLAVTMYWAARLEWVSGRSVVPEGLRSIPRNSDPSKPKS